MYFFNVPSMTYKKKRDRVFIKSITGQKLQLTFMRLEPGEITNHRHRQEQMGYIVSGEVEVTIDGHTRVLGPGDAYAIPGDVQHGFRVTHAEGVEYLEVFSPPKEENQT
jgi:quercetin dioxygenase-like cupin family protein